VNEVLSRYMLQEATLACGRVCVWVLEICTLNYLISLHNSYSFFKRNWSCYFCEGLWNWFIAYSIANL